MEQGIKWVAVLLLALSGFSAFADWTFGAFDAYGNDVTIKNESGQTLYGTCLDAEAHKIRVIKNKIGNVETLDLSERVVDKNGVEWRITVIKDWGFEDLTSLREVILPNSLEEIGKEAFKGCTGLTTVKPFFPSTLTNVKARAFYNCSLEGTLKLSSKSPSIIGSSAFAGESQRFRLVDLSEGNVVRIADKAFQNHTNLQSAILSSGLLAIGESTFSGCQQLGNVVLSPVLRTIGAMAFSGCRQLTHVEPFLPDTLTSLGYRSFLDCPVAGDLSLKCPGLQTVGDSAFGRADDSTARAITSVDMSGSGITCVDPWAFSTQGNIVWVRLSSGFTSIGANAFSGCSKIVQVYFENDFGIPSLESKNSVVPATQNARTVRLYFPKDSAAWRQYFAEHGQTLSEEERRAFREKFPDERRRPLGVINYPTSTGNPQYLVPWNPQPTGLIVIVR